VAFEKDGGKDPFGLDDLVDNKKGGEGEEEERSPSRSPKRRRRD
jgi:hypothetical protein